MSDHRNRVGEFMLQHGIRMGDKLDAGRVQDLLEKYYEVLSDANSLCRSAHSIAARNGLQTNWSAFLAQLERSLKLQHAIMYPMASPPSPPISPENLEFLRSLRPAWKRRKNLK